MEHIFKKVCVDVNGLLDGVETITQFNKKLIFQATEQALLRPGHWEPNLYKGAAFEALIEVFINMSVLDKRVNIVDYTPVLMDDDWGVDGVGKTHHGYTSTVQCKFSSNPRKMLTAKKDGVSNFVANSTLVYDVVVNLEEPKESGALVLFTTAKGIDQNLFNNMYGGKVKVFGINELKKFLDGNKVFWGMFRKQLSE